MNKIGIILMFMVIATAFSGVKAAAFEYGYVSITLLNQDPDPAEPGEYVELRWKVVKRGTLTVDNIMFELQPDYPFSFDQSDQARKKLDAWRGIDEDEEFFTLYYKLRVDSEALEDTYKMKLRYSYDDEIWETRDFDVRVGDKPKPKFVLGNLITTPTKLVGDTDEATLNMEITNIGDGDAEHVQTQIVLPEGFKPTYTNSDEANMGTIAAGGSDSSMFYVDIDESVVSQVYQAKVIVRYKEANADDNKYKQVELPLDISIKSRPVFEIKEVITDPQTVHAGNKVHVRIKVANEGGKEAESLSLRAFKETSQPFDFDEKTDYIGKLEVGAEGEAILEMTIDDDAQSKKYLIDLELRYVDGNEVLVQEKTIPFFIADGLQSESSQGGFSRSVGIGLMAAVVIVGLIAYLAGKKASRKK